jgi:plasmid stability protein
MVSVQIKDVPEAVHAELRRRAAAVGKSLQEYLLGRLTDEVKYPPVDEVLERAGKRRGGRLSFGTAVSSVRHDRDRR